MSLALTGTLKELLKRLFVKKLVLISVTLIVHIFKRMPKSKNRSMLHSYSTNLSRILGTVGTGTRYGVPFNIFVQESLHICHTRDILRRGGEHSEGVL